MKYKSSAAVLTAFVMIAALLTSCAGPSDRYNTQKGAAIGAGVGALMGQAIGENTESTLIGAAVGTLLGAVAGNAVDQSEEAAREAYQTNKRVVYYDGEGGAVEAVPGPYLSSSSNKDRSETKCKKVTKRVWNKGELVSETVEEICEGEKTSMDY